VSRSRVFRSMRSLAARESRGRSRSHSWTVRKASIPRPILSKQSETERLSGSVGALGEKSPGVTRAPPFFNAQPAPPSRHCSQMGFWRATNRRSPRRRGLRPRHPPRTRPLAPNSPPPRVVGKVPPWLRRRECFARSRHRRGRMHIGRLSMLELVPPTAQPQPPDDPALVAAGPSIPPVSAATT
jgi:hypothetical protein